MLQQELLEKVIRVLEDEGIDYMVTGSVVSSLQGEPRSTHDIDLVVNIRPDDVKKITRAFHAPEFYLDEEVIYEAIEHKNMFNILMPCMVTKLIFGCLRMNHLTDLVLPAGVLNNSWG